MPFATSAEELRHLATHFSTRREDEGINVPPAPRFDPRTSIRVDLAAPRARGDMASARSLLTTEVAGSDPSCGGCWLDELATATCRKHGAAEKCSPTSSRRDALVASLLGGRSESGGRVRGIDVAAKTRCGSDWAVGRGPQRFVHRVPNHFCGCGWSRSARWRARSTMHSAQAQLAHAYLTVRAGIEARVIAEDSRGARAGESIEHRAVPARPRAPRGNRYGRLSRRLAAKRRSPPDSFGPPSGRS